MVTGYFPSGIRLVGGWDRRSDNVESLARGLFQSIDELSSVLPEFSKWYRTYKTVADRERGPICLNGDVDRIRETILEGHHSADARVTPERGSYLFSAFAGLPSGGLADMVVIKLHVHIDEPYLPFNSITFELGNDFQSNASMPWYLTVRKIMRCLIRSWNVDWLACVRAATESNIRVWPTGPLLGMFFYTSSNYATVDVIPERWIRCEDNQGEIIYVFEEVERTLGMVMDLSAFQAMASQVIPIGAGNSKR